MPLALVVWAVFGLILLVATVIERHVENYIAGVNLSIDALAEDLRALAYVKPQRKL